MRWTDFAWMKLAVILVILATMTEMHTVLGQWTAAAALIAVIIDFISDLYSEDDQ